MRAGSINIANQLRGRKVTLRGGGEELGCVTDALIDPLKGKALGITALGRGGTQFFISATDLVLEGDKVLSLITESRPASAIAHGVRAIGEMLGASVVTREGQLLGSISEIHLLPSHHFIVYRVTESRWQRLFGEGFFIAGDLPYAYSREGMRLIVPARTERLYSFQTILDRIGSHETAWKVSPIGSQKRTAWDRPALFDQTGNSQ